MHHTRTLALAAALALGLAGRAQAQASYDPATQVLSVPTISVGTQVYRDFKARLDADGRLTVLALTPPAPDLAARTAAATATAQSAANACAAIRPFYWEIGDAVQRLAGGSVNAANGANSVDATTVMNIASASKWLYGAYVAQRRGGALTAEDIQFLNFRSGYTSFGFSGCEPADTVASCVARADNGVQTPAHIDRFFYNGGHMQKHASLPAPGMALGALNNTTLAAEMRRVLGADIELSFTQPQLAGGVRMNARSYALFLRKLLGGQLQLGALLGSHPVCTNPLTCPGAVYSPAPANSSEHYSIGHWVEDDPAVGDGAFSSPGAFGFYPWVDASRTLYGVVARFDLLGQGIGFASQQCGALVRKAWVTGSAQ
ncbi:MAG: hypothetical protein HY855_01190 [Burkholderiales bacterium]|nr:hypothetical protein [Burkholderiales bacterium]